MTDFKIISKVLLIATIVFLITGVDVNAASNNKTCIASGCYRAACKNSYYCSTHKCSDDRCQKKKTDDSRYCSYHTCKVSGCTNHIDYTSGSWKGYCSDCRVAITEAYNKQNHNKTTTNKTTTYKTSSSKKTTTKKYDMPDCDDYDSYEEFMDDWDGCMPDGSDAEDYWENW